MGPPDIYHKNSYRRKKKVIILFGQRPKRGNVLQNVGDILSVCPSVHTSICLSVCTSVYTPLAQAPLTRPRLRLSPPSPGPDPPGPGPLA